MNSKGTFIALPYVQDQVRRVALFWAGLLALGAGVVAQEERRRTGRWDVFGLCAPRITARLSAKNAICWRLQPISAQRSSNSIQIGNAGCKNPPMTGALGWLNNSILLIPYLCCCSEIITHTAARLFFISPRFLLNYLVRSGSGTHMTCDFITSTCCSSCPETCQHIIKKMNVKAEQHDVSYVILNSIAFVLCWAAACPCQSDMGTCSVPFN